ncbi:M23 family metallopeptidase [Salinispira pacifica]
MTVYAQEDGDGGFDLYADSHRTIDTWLFLELDDVVNLVPDRGMPFAGLIPARARGFYLFSLHPAGRGVRSYRLEYTFARGNPETARHDDSHLYLFPFEHAKKHRVTQGYNGRFTHFGENRYALDFDLEVGTPVFAARGGVVAEVKQNSSRGGPGEEYDRDGNYILIAHPDGSFGNYVHLRRNGARVVPGERVEPGQFIGFSGNTGRTSGPHLHFDVRVPTRRGSMRSIPVRFLGVPEYSAGRGETSTSAAREAAAGTERSLPLGRIGSGRGGPTTTMDDGARDSGIIAVDGGRTLFRGPHRTTPAAESPRGAGAASRAHLLSRPPLRARHAGPAVSPAEGRYYYAYHPDRPLFQPVYGDDLTNDDFSGYERAIAPNARVELRVERIDSTYVVFLRNGLSVGAVVQTSFSLNRMVSSVRMPTRIDMPGATERFLTLLRPESNAARFSYSCRLRIATRR